jgi:hypothetical protein
MKARLLRRAAKEFYHGSAIGLPAGTILEPRKDGYVKSDDTYGIAATEAILERNRPTHCIPRHDSVFMADDIDNIEWMGGQTDFILRVEPVGRVESNSLGWYEALELYTWNDDGDPMANWLAQGYWSGEMMPDARYNLVEYRAESAVVVSLVETN